MGMAAPGGCAGMVAAVLAHLGIAGAQAGAQLLGRSGEGDVYEFGDDRVVKISPRGSERELQRLATFQEWLARQEFPFHIPRMLEIDRLDATVSTIESRLPGETLSGRFSSLSEDQQRLALTNY
jgi:hypothetical protein